MLSAHNKKMFLTNKILISSICVSSLDRYAALEREFMVTKSNLKTHLTLTEVDGNPRYIYEKHKHHKVRLLCWAAFIEISNNTNI